MRELEGSLQQFGEFLLVKEKAAPCPGIVYGSSWNTLSCMPSQS